MTRAFAAGMALCAFAVFARAQDDRNVEKIQTLLAKPDTLCGHFEQAKTLVGLKKPVISSGRFCVVAGKGVLWRTLVPFPASVRLTRDEIVESNGDQVTNRLSTREDPGVRVVTELLFSLLAGDVKRLSTSFDVGVKFAGKNWQAALTPRDAGMRRVVGRIELNGGEYVSSITIREAGGDRTDITFSAIATGQGAMQPGEAKQFG